MKPLISVIVPIYKVEAYLEDCVNSLLRQTLENIEIILVDDGSPDRCGEMCDAYAAKDKRIRVIHQENQGLSAARNAGIDAAQADYLMFVDSDDWVEEDFCSHPYELALKYHADLVAFQYQRTKQPFQSCSEPSGLKDEERLQWLMHHGVGDFAWNKLYQRDLFNTLCFPIGKVYEDTAVTHLIAHKAKRIYYSDRILYHYRIRQGSIVTSSNANALRQYYHFLIQRANAFETWGFHKLAFEVITHARWDYLLTISSKDAEAKACLQFLLTQKTYPAFFSWRSKWMLKLCRLSPPLFNLFCKLFRRRTTT